MAIRLSGIMEAGESRPVVRPLAPVTLAFMLGLASPAWGVRLPGAWPLPGMLLLWLLLVVLFFAHRRPRLAPLLFFWLLGVAFYQQASHPVFPPHHLVNLPLNQDLTLLGSLDRPGKVGPERVQLSVAVEAFGGGGQGFPQARTPVPLPPSSSANPPPPTPYKGLGGEINVEQPPPAVILQARAPAPHSPSPPLNPPAWLPATGKLLVTAPSLEPPPVGTRVVFRGRLRAPEVLKNPGVGHRPRQLAAEGVFRQVRLRRPGDLVFLASTEGFPLREKLRGGIRRLLKELPPEPLAVFLAMLLGDQGEITPQLRQALSRTNTSHLLVINGMHLGMVAAVTYGLVSWIMRLFPWLLLRINVYKAATLLAAGPVVAYAWMAGGSPSTQRAEIMILAFLLLVFLGRPREYWSALALAALIILSLTPLRLFSVSFQLSFAAVAALIYLLPRWFGTDRGERTMAGIMSGPAARLWRRGKEALAVSVAAALATAPLVAAYFQVVSALGILVNLVAIPLVLGLALPLGEAAVLTQSLSLTPVARVLLHVGSYPLMLGFSAIKFAAGLPGAAFTVSTPTFLQIACYYLILILLFWPGRKAGNADGQLSTENRKPKTENLNPYTGIKTLNWRWVGICLAGTALAASIAWPCLFPHKRLEVTCLDTYRGLAGIVVTPEGGRLAVSAPGSAWLGRGAAAGGPLPGYLHWRQWRRLDQVMALGLGEGNARELLDLAGQFAVGPFWYGRRGVAGPAAWDLWNFLGDRGRAPRSLEKSRPPGALGRVALAFPSLGTDQDVALCLAYQGRSILILPPVRHLDGRGLARTLRDAGPGTRAGAPVAGGAEGEGKEAVAQTAAVIAPAELETTGELAPLLSILKPHCLVIYGRARAQPISGSPGAMACHRTREGAVSLYLADGELTVSQWQPH